MISKCFERSKAMLGDFFNTFNIFTCSVIFPFYISFIPYDIKYAYVHQGILKNLLVWDGFISFCVFVYLSSS